MGKTRSVAFWTTTAVTIFILGSGGVADLSHAPSTRAGMTELRYPAYVMTILGSWKFSARWRLGHRVFRW
ncbi:DoxX family protein [Nocardia sp. NPDC057455]|uniref:DoxX family protein n=1 Tax=Nocardia sp. NPDC057455 TaxID=3346138 RepID=UPI00366A745F